MPLFIISSNYQQEASHQGHWDWWRQWYRILIIDDISDKMFLVLLNIIMSWKIAFAAFPSFDRIYGWVVRVEGSIFLERVRRRKPGLPDLLPANRATIGKCKVHQSCRRRSSNQIFQECRFDYLITFGPQFVNYIHPFGTIGQNGFGLSKAINIENHQN